MYTPVEEEFCSASPVIQSTTRQTWTIDLLRASDYLCDWESALWYTTLNNTMALCGSPAHEGGLYHNKTTSNNSLQISYDVKGEDLLLGVDSIYQLLNHYGLDRECSELMNVDKQNLSSSEALCCLRIKSWVCQILV